MDRKVIDSSFLVSCIRSCDANHVACYTYSQNTEDFIWVVPSIAYFEYQATQSRLEREGKKAYRELYLPNVESYDISLDLIREASKRDLANLFYKLRGADLIFACIAKIEGIPLVTCDSHFDEYCNEINIINPTK